MENVSNFAVSIVPADDLAPCGARASVGTVMTKVGSLIYSGPALEGLSVVGQLALWISTGSVVFKQIRTICTIF